MYRPISFFLSLAIGAIFAGSAARAADPDKTGMHAALPGVAFVAATNSAAGTVYTVPAGKRLVIENASANCGVASPEQVKYSYLYFNNQGTNAAHALVPVKTGDALSLSTFVISWSGRLYADAGPIQFGAVKNGQVFAPGYACYFSISGYLVQAP